METTDQYIVSIILISLGTFLILKSHWVSIKLKKFYINQPIIHYAGERQLTAKPVYMIIFGVLFILIGIFGLIAGIQ